jgi:pantoate--beta-alanine ligase
MKPKMINNVSLMSAMAEHWNYSPRVALVPTMGFLHDGHLALVREAAARAETVIVSIFVNPLQFGPSEDLAEYPRDLARDAMQLSEVGADIVFAPVANHITPPDMAFKVDPGRMASVLCGEFRPGHFAGVSTIVAKLFNIVRPGVAVFGWKDAQQFLLLAKMVADLNMPVELHALETRREPDGLAMSSRNVYLSVPERKAASVIQKGLADLEKACKKGVRGSDELLQIFRSCIRKEPLLRLQYAKAVTLDTLEPLDKVQEGNTLFAVAVYAGETRLIDNLRL